MIKINWLQENSAQQINLAAAKSAIRQLNKLIGAKFSGTINVKIASSDKVKRLNAEFAHKPTATDVLSFNYAENTSMLSEEIGDVVINREDVHASNSPETKLARLAIHGILHILGYDHATLAQKARFNRLAERLIDHN